MSADIEAKCHPASLANQDLSGSLRVSEPLVSANINLAPTMEWMKSMEPDISEARSIAALGEELRRSYHSNLASIAEMCRSFGFDVSARARDALTASVQIQEAVAASMQAEVRDALAAAEQMRLYMPQLQVTTPSETDLLSKVITPRTGAIELKSSSIAKVTMRGNLKVTSSSPEPVRIARMPATNLAAALRWLLTPKAYLHIVAPLVAQEQHEYYEALLRGDERLARWIAVRMYVLILWSTYRGFVAPIIRMLKDISN